MSSSSSPTLQARLRAASSSAIFDSGDRRHFLAQGYIDNEGFDIKVYNTGSGIFAVRWPSPLHTEVRVTPQLVPLTPELREVALGFGRAFGLTVYGVDVVLTSKGWVAVDVNDFPSFHQVPDASERIAATIVRTAAAARARVGAATGAGMGTGQGTGRAASAREGRWTPARTPA